MKLLTLAIVTLLFILVRSSDLAISAGLARSYARAIAYGIVAVLALILTLITLLGLH